MKVVNALLEHIQKTEYDLLLITGDITNVSAKIEFERARKILKPVLDERAFLIPGNHDRYLLKTAHDFEKAFGEFQGDPVPSLALQNFQQKTLNRTPYLRFLERKGYLVLGLDSSYPLSISEAWGELDLDLLKTGMEFAKSQKKPYLLCIHHPIWNPAAHPESWNHRLRNREEAIEVLKSYPPVAVFHGHLHSNWFRKPDGNIPFACVNSASSTRLPYASGHRVSGFHEMEMENGVMTTISHFSFDPDSGSFVGNEVPYFSE